MANTVQKIPLPIEILIESQHQEVLGQFGAMKNAFDAVTWDMKDKVSIMRSEQKVTITQLNATVNELKEAILENAGRIEELEVAIESAKKTARVLALVTTGCIIVGLALGIYLNVYLNV